MKTNTYDCHIGYFDNEWKNPPAPFNPEYDPKAKDRFSMVTKSMEKDCYYDTHTREQCRIEWAKRYDNLKDTGQ